jgi:hypothetical protein
MLSRKMSVRMTGIEEAWLDAVADVRGETRAEVVRRAISWFCVRETERVERSRHYALIAYVAQQEAWNPVDDHLHAASGEEARRIPGSMQSAYKRAKITAGDCPDTITPEIVYFGPERRLQPR